MFRAALNRHRDREVKTIGDAFLAMFDATTQAVRAASEIVTGAKRLRLEVRAGVHNGDVEVRPDYVVGLAVTNSKRICDMADPGELPLTEAVKSHLVGSDIATSERGPQRCTRRVAAIRRRGLIPYMQIDTVRNVYTRVAGETCLILLGSTRIHPLISSGRNLFGWRDGWASPGRRPTTGISPGSPPM